MTERRLLAVLVLLVIASGAALADEWRRDRAERQRVRAFQRLVGGLGCGAELDGSRCWYAFDPRLAIRCTHSRGPLPNGQQFCACHWASIFYLPPRPDPSWE